MINSRMDDHTPTQMAGNIYNESNKTIYQQHNIMARECKITVHESYTGGKRYHGYGSGKMIEKENGYIGINFVMYCSHC